MKLFFLDLETTGTEHWRHGIHQISGLVEIDGEVKETFDFKVKPNPKAQIVPEALAVAGITEADLAGYADMKTTYQEMTRILGRYVNKYDKTDKFWIVGYNCQQFDSPFFRAWFKQNGDEYFGSWFWSVTMDVIVQAAFYFKDDRATLKDFKLNTIARAVGVDVDELRLHDAVYDIEVTRAAFYAMQTPKPKPATQGSLLDLKAALYPEPEIRYCRNCGRDLLHRPAQVGPTSVKVLFWECDFCHEHGDAI